MMCMMCIMKTYELENRPFGTEVAVPLHYEFPLAFTSTRRSPCQYETIWTSADFVECKVPSHNVTRILAIIESTSPDPKSNGQCLKHRLDNFAGVQ